MAAADNFLIEVAESEKDADADSDEGFPAKPREPATIASAAEEARMLLASNGVEPYSSHALEAELDRIARNGYFWGHEIRHFVRWPRSVVRAALLKRLEENDASSSLLSAFEWFALSTDRAIFERYEQSSRLDVADVAHQYLEGV
jgi:hypothetical protein